MRPGLGDQEWSGVWRGPDEAGWYMMKISGCPTLGKMTATSFNVHCILRSRAIFDQLFQKSCLLSRIDFDSPLGPCFDIFWGPGPSPEGAPRVATNVNRSFFYRLRSSGSKSLEVSRWFGLELPEFPNKNGVDARRAGKNSGAGFGGLVFWCFWWW